MSLQWIVCHRRATAPCICTLKSLTVSSLLFLFFPPPLYNSRKRSLQMFPWLLCQKLSDWYEEMSAESKSNKKKQQPDYSFLWKVTCDTVSRECKIHLWNIMCAQAGVSPLSLKKKQLAEDTLNFSHVLSFVPRNSTASHHKTFAMPSQLAYAVLQQAALCLRHTIWCLHQADCLHASHFVSFHSLAHSHRQWKM